MFLSTLNTCSQHALLGCTVSMMSKETPNSYVDFSISHLQKKKEIFLNVTYYLYSSLTIYTWLDVTTSKINQYYVCLYTFLHQEAVQTQSSNDFERMIKHNVACSYVAQNVQLNLFSVVRASGLGTLCFCIIFCKWHQMRALHISASLVILLWPAGLLENN